MTRFPLSTVPELPALIVGLLILTGCGNKILETVCVPGESNACGCGMGTVGVQVCTQQGTLDVCDCTGTMTCVPGTSVSCGCAGGATGAQVCGPDRTYAACSCVPAPLCEPGVSMECRCAGNLQGARLCGANNIFGPCSCQSPELTMGVLDFPDPSPQVATHANHGIFWAENVDLGSYFYWDAWVAPRTPGYLVSDGYGGAHAMLWGPVMTDGQLLFQGDIWNGTQSVSFGAGEGPAPGEWGHHALGMAPDPRHGNALTIYAFWNGICVGMTRFGATTRHATNLANGASELFVMGSNHQNLGGRLVALRAWDKSWPTASQNPPWAFVPDRVFSPAPGGASVDFLAEYTRPAVHIPDLSPLGYGGGGTGVPQRHPGKLANAIVIAQMSNDSGFYGTMEPLGPLPTWMEDPDCPYGPAQTAGVSRTTPPAPDPPPDQALVFDSFARANQNFVWQRVPSLGKTESGSLGPLDWKTATIGAPVMAAPFGLITGRAVFLERLPGLAWVDAGTTEQDVRVERVKIRWAYGTTGLAFRVTNAQTWSYLFADEEQSAPGVPPPLLLGSFVDGVAGPVTSIMPPNDDWIFLRVVAQASTVTVYVSPYHADNWVKVATVENRPATATATGAGLTGAAVTAQATSLWRAETFTLCPPGTCP